MRGPPHPTWNQVSCTLVYWPADAANFLITLISTNSRHLFTPHVARAVVSFRQINRTYDGNFVNSSSFNILESLHLLRIVAIMTGERCQGGLLLSACEVWDYLQSEGIDDEVGRATVNVSSVEKEDEGTD